MYHMFHLRIRNYPVRFGRVLTPIAMTASAVIRAIVKISTRIPARTSAPTTLVRTVHLDTPDS
jgi:hypothetical protein